MNTDTRRRFAVAFFSAFLGISILFAGILVCPECGYENPDDGGLCVHCKGKLPPPKPKDPSQSSGDAGVGTVAVGKIKYISADIVEDEIRVAEKYLKAGDLEGANLFSRNASALELLVNPEEKGSRSERISELRKKSETGGMKVSRKCPTCDGTGKSYMESSGMDGKVSNIEIAGKSCKTCGGSGNIMRLSTMDERKFRLGRALKHYNAEQQGRRYVAVGGTWVPAELEPKLSIKQIARLKGAMAASCPDCMGLGRLDCVKCKGQGEVKCTAQGCVNGKVTAEDTGGFSSSKTSKSKMKVTQKCKTCNGIGFVVCIDCRGIGNTVCKKCSGSGERPSCSKCGGKGQVLCKRCQGTGAVKGIACAECRGEGSQECSTCNGDGKKK